MAYPRTAKFVALVVALLAAFTELLTFGAVRFSHHTCFLKRMPISAPSMRIKPRQGRVAG